MSSRADITENGVDEANSIDLRPVSNETDKSDEKENLRPQRSPTSVRPNKFAVREKIPPPKSLVELATRDFLEFFDDADVDGSGSISVIEFTASLSELDKTFTKLGDAKKRVKLILRIYNYKMEQLGKPEEQVILMSQERDENDALDPDEKELLKDFVEDGDITALQDVISGTMHKKQKSRGAISLNDLSRQKLVDVLLFAYQHHLISGYVPGSYVDKRERTYASLKDLSTPMPRILYEQFQFLLFPIWAVWVFTVDGPTNNFLSIKPHHRVMYCLISLPFFCMAYLLPYIFYNDLGNVRTDNFIKTSEFFSPLWYLLLMVTMWNIGRMYEGLGPYQRFKLQSPGHEQRYRTLQKLPVRNVRVYHLDEDTLKAEWLVDEDITNAYQIFKTLYNVQGMMHPSQAYLIVSEKWLFMNQKHNLLRSRVLFKQSRYTNVLLAFTYSIIPTIVRTLNGDRVFADESMTGDSGSYPYIVICCSILATTFFVFGLLSALSRIASMVQSYDNMLDMISALPEKKRLKKIQFSLPFDVRREPSLQLPWLDFEIAENVLAWNEIRLALLQEWNERFSGLPRVWSGIPIFAVIVIYIVMIVNVFAVKGDDTDIFRYQSLIGAFILTFRMYDYFAAGELANHKREDHADALKRMQLDMHVRAMRQQDEREEAMDYSDKNSRNRGYTVDKMQQKALQRQVALLDVFSASLLTSTKSYFLIFGFTVDDEFIATFRGLFTAWTLLVVANFVFKDSNF